MSVNAWFPIRCGRYVGWCGPHKFRRSRTCVFVFSEVHRTMKRTSCCPQFNKTILFTLLKYGCNFTLLRFQPPACTSVLKCEDCMWHLNVNWCRLIFLRKIRELRSLIWKDSTACCCGYHALLSRVHTECQHWCWSWLFWIGLESIWILPLVLMLGVNDGIGNNVFFQVSTLVSTR